MKSFSKGYSVLLILLSAVFFLMILRHVPLQLDFTSQRMYTLSKGSKSILKGIETPVMLDFYFSSSSEAAPTSLKNFGDRIEVFLKQYERYSNGNIQLRIIDPKPDTAEEEAAIRAGVQNIQLPDGGSFFMGLTASQAEQEASINLFTLEREPYLEYDISKLLTDVQRVDQAKLAIITSLPVEGSEIPPQMMMQMQSPTRGEPEWSFYSQLKERYEISVIRSTDESASLDKGYDMLLVLHPTGISEGLSYEIDQFVLSRKPVFIAVDPSSVTQKQSMNQQQMMMGMSGGMEGSDLPTLFDHWGVKYDTRKLVGDLDFATRVSSGRGQPVPYPIWINLNDLQADLPALAPLHQVLFAESGFFEKDDQQETGLTWKPVIQSSHNAATIDTMMTLYSAPAQLLSEVQKQLGMASPDKSPAPYTLATVINGKFTTAYPNGKPVKTSDDNPDPASEGGTPAVSEVETGQPKAPRYTEGEGMVFLIADSDWAADRFSVERMNFLGNTMLRPLNDNLSLMLNVVDQLAGSQDLIALRGRGNVNRSFVRVEKLEVLAQVRYQEQLESVNQRLSEVQSEISKIQGQQQSDGSLIASDALKKAIAEYREQEANVIAERREIRKKLREDIEALNRNLILINLLLVPGLLTLFGLRFFFKRSRAQA